jgi:hypothetical protein
MDMIVFLPIKLDNKDKDKGVNNRITKVEDKPKPLKKPPQYNLPQIKNTKSIM